MNTRFSSRRALVPVVAAAALLVTACGDDGDDDGTDTTDADTTETEATDAEATDAEATENDGTAAESTAAESTDGDEAATTNGTDAGGETGAGDEELGSLTVGSADFGESQVLAQIYGQALEEAGFDVSYQMNIGAREIYYGAIEDGEIDLVPEYTNSLLSHVLQQDNPDAVPVAASIDEQLLELEAVLPESLTALPASEAEDRDVIVCTEEVATEHGLTSLPDLADVASELSLAAPPEFAERAPFGAPGFEQEYGFEFGEFIPLPPAQVADTLIAGEADCGNLFSTNPIIETEGLVALEDVDGLVPFEAVLPLVRAEVVNDTLTEVLADVNDDLDTEQLIELNVQIDVEQLAADEVAEEWLANR